MARVQVPPVRSTSKLVALTPAAPTAGAGNGDAVRPNSIVLFHNTSGSAISATVLTGALVGDLPVDDATISIPTGDSALGPFESWFKQISGTDVGWVAIEYASVTGLTRSVIAAA